MNDCKKQLKQLMKGDKLTQACKQHKPEIDRCTLECRPEIGRKMQCLRKCFGTDSLRMEEACAGEWSDLVNRVEVADVCKPFQTQFFDCDAQCKAIGSYWVKEKKSSTKSTKKQG
ncbi:hypothetical protein Ciccas_013479 [Cichlidogyrus casuarinus]|uniref:Domain of unknown function DB domain-containing protein n=1 Tax=Cichlidogyrus casuarinus TaxID=1844966 RepID=A0ABD2PKG3_9PLAT